MKIGIYTPYLDTLTGGELYMLTIAEHLSIDHDVSIFWDDKSIIDKASDRFNLKLSKVSLVQDIFSGGFSAKDKFLRTLKYDRIIYLSDGSFPLIFPKKMIVHFQSPLLGKKIPANEKNKTISLRKVICNSAFTKSYIDKAYGINSNILYPPVQNISSPNIKKENIILTVGRYQPYSHNSDFKKLSFMIQSFKKLSKKNKGWSLRIIASIKPEHEKSFKENVEIYVNDSIEIIKNTDFDMVNDSYNRAKIYWHAAGFGENIEAHPERAEHFGMSTVEAMSAGCVPVVINLGGQKEIVTPAENGYLWNTQEELLTVTEDLISNPQSMKELSLNAKYISDKFSKKRFCSELDKIIK